MKRLFTLALACLMALSLAACGGSSGGGADANQTADNGSDANETAVTYLNIWQPSDKESVENWWVEKLAEWNAAHPDIQVSRDAIDRSDSYAYDNKVATAVTSNSLPDILYVDGPQVSYYAANGITLPLTSYFPDTSDFVDSTVAECTYNGDLYAITATESSVALYYNIDYMKECGVDLDQLAAYTVDNPIKWSEFEVLAAQCTTENYVGTHIVMDHGEGLPYALEPMYVSNGVDYISADGTTAQGYVNSPEAVETTAFLANLIAKGYANVDPITDEFLNGACATEIQGSWDVTVLEAADFEWGVTYYPVSDKTGTPVSPCGDWAAAITRNCSNPDAAGEFLQWLMSPENVASYSAAISKPASRLSAYEDPAMAAYKEYPLSVFQEELSNNASPRPRTPSYATFSTDYAEAMTNIFARAASNGEVDESYIQEQLDNVASKFEKDYNDYYA
ncbi:MAG: sugar ABC transporter substrate-binding protein [Oscillospiraceae bacterium]|nr:sugar ABC transporter substrate-binding protein [Oscillospiraceae bacterium]